MSLHERSLQFPVACAVLGLQLRGAVPHSRQVPARAVQRLTIAFAHMQLQKEINTRTCRTWSEAEQHEMSMLLLHTESTRGALPLYWVHRDLYDSHQDKQPVAARSHPTTGWQHAVPARLAAPVVPAHRARGTSDQAQT